jgi:hypothetical protein
MVKFTKEMLDDPIVMRKLLTVFAYAFMITLLTRCAVDIFG